MDGLQRLARARRLRINHRLLFDPRTSQPLEHERAEREQEMEEKRKSETAEQQRKEIPPSLEKYLKQRKAEIEMFKRVTPELNPYFQGLVDEYFRSLRGEK